MKLKLAISSCPNDTFMFDALINKKIDIAGYEFDLIIADIEQLNKMAFELLPDITKVSYHSFFKIMDNYQLLSSGSALGKSCGPLLISKHKIYPDELSDCSIAIPGENTTARLLLSLLFPNVSKTKEYLFADIEDVVLSNECDAGLVIHETRFTYRDRGLNLVADLGSLWEQKFNLPIPLGGIAVKRSLQYNVKNEISDVLRLSVEFAMSNPSSALNFMKQYAQDMDESVMMKHVDLYVNNYSIELGDEGIASIIKLKDEFLKLNKTRDDKKLKLFV